MSSFGDMKMNKDIHKKFMNYFKNSLDFRILLC